MQMDMPHACFGGNGIIQFIFFFQMAEQGLHIQGFTPVAQCAVRTAGDEIIVLDCECAIFGQFAIQLNAVAFGVIKIGGLGHDMVGGIVAIFQHRQTRHRPRQFTATGEQNREVIQSCHAAIFFQVGFFGQAQQVRAASAEACFISFTPVEFEIQVPADRRRSDSPDWQLSMRHDQSCVAG